MKVYVLFVKDKVLSVTFKTVKKVCRRCDGQGQLPSFRHVSGGVCFACNGSGNRLIELLYIEEIEAANNGFERCTSS